MDLLGKLLGAFGLALLLIGFSAMPAFSALATGIAAQVEPEEEEDDEPVNECTPGGNLVLPTCSGRCVDGATSYSCTPRQEEREVHGETVTVNVCYC